MNMQEALILDEQKKRVKEALEEWSFTLGSVDVTLLNEFLEGKRTIRQTKRLVGDENTICCLPRSVRRALTPVRLVDGKFLPK